MKNFIKPVHSESVQAEVISKLGFYLCGQAELMREHVHSDLWVAPKETVQYGMVQYMALVVTMHWSSTPLAPALRHVAAGEELRLEARGCRVSDAWSPWQQSRQPPCPARHLFTHPQCTGARHQAGQMPQ